MNSEILPKIELSNETIIHKKINSNNILLIPNGNYYLLWFNKSGTWLINNNNRGMKEKKNCSFHPSLSLGTILFGVCFKYENINFFVIEDILYYKGKHIASNTFQSKISLFEVLLKREIQQQPTNDPNDIIIGLPIITTINEISIDFIDSLPYQVKYIQFRNSYKQNGNHRFQLLLENFRKSFEKIFLVKPDIKNDIYHLYNMNNQFVDVACIPDYKTSVFMNKLFRNIKENDNLDLLEESDDEDEKQFVYLDREYKMLCSYNKKFKKWVPLNVVNI